MVPVSKCMQKHLIYLSLTEYMLLLWSSDLIYLSLSLSLKKNMLINVVVLIFP